MYNFDVYLGKQWLGLHKLTISCADIYNLAYNANVHIIYSYSPNTLYADFKV